MKNPAFATFQDVRAAVVAQMGNSFGNDSYDSLDYALVNAPRTSSLRVLHPLFFRQWREPRRKIATHPVHVVGLDVETDAATGAPRLLGYWYPTTETYYADETPSLERFMRVTRNLRDKTDAHFCVWGRLDIQVVLRLFAPSETERIRIARGVSGKVRDGQITVPFPLLRTLKDGTPCYIAHYIPGRSLRIGWIDSERFERSMWIYNISQYYPGRIADTARGLALDWRDFDKKTHLIDWTLYHTDIEYRAICRESNKQDARIVAALAERIQSDFHDVIGAYPSQLVSTGSLTDAAVSALLNDDDYKATSWVWLRRNGLGSPETVARLDTILAEAFSAGYVDQYALGYFPSVSTADISAAYPHKIRALPDLRYAVLINGSGQLDDDMRAARRSYDVETAVIRGRVTIPPTLLYHPITIRNWQRQNLRVIGTFNAAYTWDEREYCRTHGATFAHEEYTIVALTERKQSPIARVSESLGKMRADLIEQRSATPKNTDEWRTLDARQYVVKVVDNSLYGKTTMTLEDVEMVDGQPRIVGYTTGDRYNALYATLITARTRTQLADACMRIKANGGNPIMCMTDSVYWDGTPDMLPTELWRNGKVAGYFEKPEIVTDFYILKTGQYEYKESAAFHHKLRGIPVAFENVTSSHSFYRELLQSLLVSHDASTPNGEIRVTIPTRKLATIGQNNMDLLGAVVDSEMVLRPFALSSKSTAFPFHWRDCIDDHVWLPPVLAPDTDAVPYDILRQMYEQGIAQYARTFRDRVNSNKQTMRQRKSAYALVNTTVTKKPLPNIPSLGDARWSTLRRYYEDTGETGWIERG